MFITIILFITILGFLIFVHELGHFITAKKTGMQVDEFGFGFPPRMLGIQKNSDKTKPKKWRFIFSKKQLDPKNTNTIYSINWLPFGGFVKIKGEQGDHQDDQNSFASKKLWKRAIVLSSGVVMNFILAFMIITIGLMIGLPNILGDSLPENAVVKDQRIQVIEVVNDSPAEEAGLKFGDIITSVDDVDVSTVNAFTTITGKKLGEEVSIDVKRGNEIISTTFVPEDLNKDGVGKAGIHLAETGIVSYPWYQAIWIGAKTTVVLSWTIIVAFFNVIKDLIINQRVSADIAGPIGIAVITGQVAKLGFVYVLQFTALLSINLAILNFMPFPALDGGRILFLIIEKIKGKPINKKVEGVIHTVGFFILIGLVVLVTVKDVAKFGDSFKNFFSDIF